MTIKPTVSDPYQMDAGVGPFSQPSYFQHIFINLMGSQNPTGAGVKFHRGCNFPHDYFASGWVFAQPTHCHPYIEL
jgi:hypothetical protein